MKLFANFGLISIKSSIFVVRKKKGILFGLQTSFFYDKQLCKQQKLYK